MTIPLDAIVELDRLNMTPIIATAGGKFDPAFRRSRLIAEIEAGSELDAVWRNNWLAAYLEVRITENRCKVQSIQIHPDYQNGFILASLLGKLCQRLQKAPMLTVFSSVHEGNVKSRSLHHKLGFDQINREGDRLLFEINSYDLIERLNRFGRRGV